jgi:hypothetical protein
MHCHLPVPEVILLITIVDPTCSSHLGKSESVLFREAEQAKTRKHVLKGATMVPLVVSTLESLGLLMKFTYKT